MTVCVNKEEVGPVPVGHSWELLPLDQYINPINPDITVYVIACKTEYAGQKYGYFEEELSIQAVEDSFAEVFSVGAEE